MPTGSRLDIQGYGIWSRCPIAIPEKTKLQDVSIDAGVVANVGDVGTHGVRGTGLVPQSDHKTKCKEGGEGADKSHVVELESQVAEIEAFTANR